MYRLLLFTLLCCSALLCCVEASEMSAQQRRGQQIYLTGNSPSGHPIQARLNDSGGLLPATLMPCVNCHKYDGIGVTEGGTTPADIRWFNLTKPYAMSVGTARPQGKSRPPYNQRSIKKAIAMGTNAAGQPLNQMMPRYQLNHQDMQDLIAFLTGLGTYQASGVSDSQINIGVILPAQNPAKAQAIRRLLDAWFNDINQQSGIYQRQLQVIYVNAPPNQNESTLKAFKTQLEQSNAFAFVASHLDGIEPFMADFSQTSGIPVIGAFSSTPLLGFPLNRYIFYLLSGQTKQAQALKLFVEQINPQLKSAIVVENTQTFKLLAHQLGEQHNNKASRADLEITSSITASGLKSLLAKRQQKQPDAVYLLVSPPAQIAFIKAAAAINWWPKILLPASQMNGALFNSPSGFDQHIFVAMPNLPFDYKSAGMAEYERLKKNHQFMPQYRSSQLLALASVKLLKQGLIKTGRTMQQPKLVAMMEGLYKFNTQLTQPISYGPNRRLGASGAYIVTLDLVKKTIRPVSNWLEIK